MFPQKITSILNSKELLSLKVVTDFWDPKNDFAMTNITYSTVLFQHFFLLLRVYVESLFLLISVVSILFLKFSKFQQLLIVSSIPIATKLPNEPRLIKKFRRNSSSMVTPRESPYRQSMAWSGQPHSITAFPESSPTGECTPNAYIGTCRSVSVGIR